VKYLLNERLWTILCSSGEPEAKANKEWQRLWARENLGTYSLQLLKAYFKAKNLLYTQVKFYNWWLKCCCKLARNVS
jgi:hypothetical protein